MNSRYSISKLTTISGTFIWIGMVCGISFLESWLKFQAPGMTIDLGVGIGRLVFDMLNKVEIFLAVLILIAWWRSKQGWKKETGYLFFGVVLAVLLVQTVIMLPIMDSRAEMRLERITLPRSYMHFYYVGGEFIKVAGLAIFGFKNIN